MAFRKTPVIYDEISGLHFHLVRWAEWTPLAFLISFLAINIDAPFKGKVPTKVDWAFPTTMALSTSAGLIFPFCKTVTTWWTVVFFSWALFFALYVVTHYRACDYLEMKGGMKHNNTKGKATANQSERLDITKASFSLCLACSVTWTHLHLSLPGDKRCQGRQLGETWFCSHCLDLYLWSHVQGLVSGVHCLMRTPKSLTKHHEVTVDWKSSEDWFMSTVWSSDVIVFLPQGRWHFRPPMFMLCRDKISILMPKWESS